MPDNLKPKKITGSIDLLHQVLNGKDMYAMPLVKGINVCAGKCDNTSCGSGCTCLSQQPFYSLEAMEKLGIRPEIDAR